MTGVKEMSAKRRKPGVILDRELPKEWSIFWIETKKMHGFVATKSVIDYVPTDGTFIRGACIAERLTEKEAEKEMERVRASPDMKTVQK